MSGNRRIVLHAGLPKTGTTSIQTAFYAERGHLLDRARLLYPSLAPNLTDALCTIFHDDPRKHITNKLAGLTTLEAIAPLQRRYQKALDAEILSTNWDTLLLSAEGLSNLSAQALSRLRDWGNRFAPRWTVFFCVRHPVDYVRSLVQQILKGGATLAELYEKVPGPAYRWKISNLINVFGRDNLTVFDFESARKHAGGVVGGFADRIGLAGRLLTRLTETVIRENESLSHEAVLLLDSINRQFPMFYGDVRAPRRSGRELDYLSRIGGHRFHLPTGVEEKIRDTTRGDVAWLNAEFSLNLYLDVIERQSDDAEPGTPPTDISQHTIDDIARVIAELSTGTNFLQLLEGGRVAVAEGDLETARQRFSEAARLDPDAPQPKKWLKRLRNAAATATD